MFSQRTSDLTYSSNVDECVCVCVCVCVLLDRINTVNCATVHKNINKNTFNRLSQCIQCQQKNKFMTMQHPDKHCGIPNLVSGEDWTLYWIVKWPGLEAEHWTPSSVSGIRFFGNISITTYVSTAKMSEYRRNILGSVKQECKLHWAQTSP